MRYVTLLSFANKILNHYEQRVRRKRLISHPVEITLEPTLQCNSNCLMCNRNFSRKETKKAEGFLSWEIFERVRPLFRFAESVEFSGFGEGLLHPEYLKMLKEIKRSGPYVHCFSNGVLLNEDMGKGLVDAGMNRIGISIGGATRETYRMIRGIDAFDTVVENIRRLTAYKRKQGKKDPELSFNVVAMTSLLGEMNSLVNLASELGVNDITMPNLVVQGAIVKDESLWLHRERAISVFKSAAKSALEKGISFHPPRLEIARSDCNAFYRRTYISWDGKVLSCPLERYILGDIRDKSFGEIWNGRGLRTLREQYNREGLECTCPNCSCWDNRPEVFLSPPENSREYAEIWE